MKYMIIPYFTAKLRKITFITCLFFSQFVSAQGHDNEILWDKFGVPHVFAQSNSEMYYCFGWAQMNNHSNLLLKLYGEARGRAAEYWGEQYIQSDRLVNTFNLPEISEQNYKKQDEVYKGFLDSFVKGMNDYADRNPTVIDAAMKKVLPVKATDVLAHMTRVMALTFVGGEDIQNGMRSKIAPGSNSLALAGTKSVSGKTMLLANPHLPWNDLYLFFEAHLNSPQFSSYGVSLIGMPILNIAFNEHLGWTHTVNPIDASDRFKLRLKDGGYVLDNAVQQFDKKIVHLKILQKDGTMKGEELNVMRSKHGPVVSTAGQTAVAIKIAGLENSFMAKQYHLMSGAKDLKEFEKAIKMLQIPMFNITYADQKGNIMYLFGGNVPVRNTGDWFFWHKNMDGSRSKFLWKKTHSYKDLPKLINPKTGFVQNCNDGAWTCTYPQMLNSKKFAAYMSPNLMPFRAQRMINLVKKQDRLSFDDLIDLKFDTGMETADRFLDDLFGAYSQYPDTGLTKAIKVLRAWDGKTDNNSRGAILFTHWFDKLNPSMYLTPWDSHNPITTPDGLKDPKACLSLLSKASKEVIKKYGSLDVRYGEINKIRLNKTEVDANGGAGDYGILRTMYFEEFQPAKNVVIAGDSYVAVIEFDKEVRAKVCLSYGNSSQSGSSHRSDQLSMISERKLRPALLSRTDIEQNLEKRELLSPKE